MDKKIPKVFANKIEHNFSNNEKVYYSFKDDNESRGLSNSSSPLVKGTTIMQKLKFIFSSPIFVYKAKVDIVTDAGILKKEVVSYNKTHVITITDELIPIASIKDIYFSK